MNRIFGSHPALCALLLGGGAFLVLFFGYGLFGPNTGGTEALFNKDLGEVWQWALTGIGVLMWLAGGLIFGLDRGFSWLTALLLQAVPGAGLLLMAMLRRPLTPHEAWARDNPALEDSTTARRTYRPMKPLY